MAVSGRAEVAPVRLSALKALIGDNEAAARSIVRNFIAHSRGIVNELSEACTAGQPTAASAAAHKLKSAARAIGAFALAELCAEMERTCDMGDQADLVEQLALLNCEEASVIAFLLMRVEQDTPIL
jgi:HPt (histidine-containing phosphotransfer) domain-containing protein